MCENRLKIGKQLSKSKVPNSIIKTDADNEQEYVEPGENGQILTIVGGVPTWSNPAVVPPSATLVDNGDGTFTYTDGATSFVIDTTDRLLTSVVYNPATQDFTYTWSNGDVTVVDLTSLLNVYNLISGTNTVVSGDGLTTAWQVNGYGVTNNGDGTYSVSTPTGVGNFTINTNETVTTLTASLDNSDPLEPILVINYANEDGTNSVQNVNLAPLLDNTDTTYILIDNEDGTVSLEGSDGSNVVIDVCAIVAANCPTTLTANADGSFSFVGSDGEIVTIPAPVAATPSTITNTISGNRIGTHTSGDGTIVDINESVTSFAAIANGYQYVSEDGTAYPFTFLFDNSTPSAPQLLVQLNGVTQSAIPLNSYDVNIETTGGFVLNPVTDEITITETDGETHAIDLSYLRSTLTSTDGSVQLVTSVNPDGSTNYDLGVKAHSNETQAVPYTGTELPTTAGVNVGDTKTVQFNDGTIVDYTWNGTTWVPDIIDAPETVTTLDIVVGGAGLPNTATYTNEAGVPVSFNFIEGARHDLRLTSPIIERGSDSPTDPKGAQFLHNSFSHLNGFSDNWIGANGEINRVLNLKNDGTVWMNGSDFSSTATSHFFYEPNTGRGSWGGQNLSANIANIGTASLVLGGYDAINKGLYSVATGGFLNEIKGGYYNTLEGGRYSSVLGNWNSILNGYSSTITAGSDNTIVGAIVSNITSGSDCTIVGGALNNINIIGNSLFYSGIYGGYGNTINQGSNNIFGGISNTITDTAAGYNTIFGGNANQVRNGSNYSAVIAGVGQYVEGDRSAAIANANSGIDRLQNYTTNLGNTNVVGYSLVAATYQSYIQSSYSAAIGGIGLVTQATATFATGGGHVTDSPCQTAIGSKSWTFTTTEKDNFDLATPNAVLFKIGNGVTTGSRGNAMTVTKNGYTSLTDVTTAPTTDADVLPQSVLDVKSLDSGILFPRIANTAAVTTPLAGMVIYDLSDNKLKCYDGTIWNNLF